MHFRVFWLATTVTIFTYACGSDDDGGSTTTCRTSGECPTGMTCSDGVCSHPRDVGPLPDGGALDSAFDGAVTPPPSCPPARTCGAECCAEGSTCGGGMCCPVVDLCGGICCGPGRRCEADRCVLDCADDRVVCGTGEEAECCATGELCYLGACTMPGRECATSADCEDGTYCEPTALRCLPRAPAGLCEYRPPVGELEIVEEWAWLGDDTVVPTHDQVMMAPMVANLTDDDGDGTIDQHDVPEVVFHTFTGSDYWESGVLRAVSGVDGSRVFPTEDPGYRTSPGGEIAIAELDAASPGPEIVACSGSNRTDRTPGRLMIVSAAGAVLRRFDTPPNDVPCGFDAPAVGDMDGDGVPEIVVRLLIAHADGTVVTRIRENGDATGSYNALADVDGDMDLEIVSPSGVYRMDGSIVWERRVDAPGRPALGDGGYVAIADLDLDGAPEIVTVGAAHSIRAIDAATGDDVWGPFDINPPELAAQVAADPSMGSGGGPPTIANFDGDPNPEIAFAGGFAYVVFDHDGARLWYFETIDRSSRVTGSSLFDFEGDGTAEVLYNDERFFRIFRGPDGGVLRELCNTSGTLREYPLVVDVDNDDHAEIVVMGNSYAFGCLDGTPSRAGIFVFGHPRNEWVRTRRIWNQHTYHVTNVEEDGRIPARERPHWTVPRLNNFRQNVQPDGLFDAPNLQLVDLRAGTRACPIELSISVRVVNAGAASAPAGVPVTFYRTDAGARTLLGRATTTRPLLPGESEVLTLAPAYVPAAGDLGPWQFEAAVNAADAMPIDTFHECDVTDNGVGPIEAECPTIG
ncbi:MAG: VCBS repeat-containing protein [Deltaproteobacteria bacterium]|nr:VCBS repeat-containing protein [Deltaproteobacteria bacterium]